MIRYTSFKPHYLLHILMAAVLFTLPAGLKAESVEPAEREEGIITMIIKDRVGLPAQRIYIVKTLAGEKYILDTAEAMAKQYRTGDRVSFVKTVESGEVTLDDIQLIAPSANL